MIQHMKSGVRVPKKYLMMKLVQFAHPIAICKIISVSSILFALIKKPRICAPLLLVQISLLTNVFTWDVTFQRTQLTKSGVKVVRAATQMEMELEAPGLME